MSIIKNCHWQYLGCSLRTAFFTSGGTGPMDHHPTMGYLKIFDAVIYVGFSFSVITT